MNISKKGINRLIFKSFMEIVIVLSVLIASYIVFNTNNLYSYADYIEENRDKEFNVMVNYNQSNKDLSDILYIENLLNKGELSIKNPNKNNKKLNIYLLIEENQNINFAGMEIDINGKKLSLENIKKVDDKYILLLDNVNLKGYEDKYLTISLLGDPYINDNFEYSFMVENS